MCIFESSRKLLVGEFEGETVSLLEKAACGVGIVGENERTLYYSLDTGISSAFACEIKM